MNPFKKYWDGLSERKQAGLRFAGVSAVLILTLWVSVAVISYVFTWRQDQSALTAGGAVDNAAASSGLSLGHFLVTDSFGLAAFCVVVFMLLWTVSILWKDCPLKLKKWFLGLFSLTFLLSWTLAFAGMYTGQEFAFGGGLGGRAGAAIVGACVGKIGEGVTIAILLALYFGWFFCMSSRFADKLMGRKEEAIEGPDETSEAPFETSDTFEEDEETEPVIAPVKTKTNRRKPQEEETVEEETPEEEENADDEGITIVTDNTLEQEVREPLKPIDNRLDPPDGLPRYQTPELSTRLPNSPSWAIT